MGIHQSHLAVCSMSVERKKGSMGSEVMIDDATKGCMQGMLTPVSWLCDLMLPVAGVTGRDV